MSNSQQQCLLMFVAKLPVNQAQNSPSTMLLLKTVCRILVNSTPEVRYVEPQYALSRKCSLEEHSVCSAYTLLCYMYHEIGSILYMYRACMIPTRYSHILKTIDTLIVLLYVRMCVRLSTIPLIREHINF